LRKRFHREHLHTFYHCRLARVCLRHHNVLDSALARSERRRKRAAHRTHASVEGQFAQKYVRIENFAEERSLATENPKRHRQVERGSFLSNVRRGKIHRNNLAEGEIKAAVAHRGLYAFAAFFDGNVRQADNAETALKARTDIYLDFNEVCVDADTAALNVLKSIPSG
jgi:hypothetical protein